jgi:hypothetical protein
MASVIVTADQDGRVIVPAGTDFGYIRVEQSTTKFTDRGFALTNTVSALVFGKLNVLRSLGWLNGQEIEGKIVIKESLTPFNYKNPEKDLKTAGTTGIVCTKGGRNIYRRAVYTQNLTAENEFIKHDNYIPGDQDVRVEEPVLTELPDLSALLQSSPAVEVLPDFGDAL